MANDVSDLLVQLSEAYFAEVKALQDRIEALEAERDKLKETHAKAITDAEWLRYGMSQALETVKYWMHDVYVCGKPMSDPRKILRIVEDAL